MRKLVPRYVFGAEKEKAKAQHTDFYQMMDTMAEEIPIGAEGLIFHPFNHGGPYWNPHLRGAFYGINLRHDKRHFFRAMLEGSVFCLKDSVLLLEERIGKRAPDYSLVGGGSRSALWTQMICDILQKDAHILKTADASLGAAMLAGIGTQIFQTPEDAITQCVEREKEVYVIVKIVRNMMYCTNFTTASMTILCRTAVSFKQPWRDSETH